MDGSHQGLQRQESRTPPVQKDTSSKKRERALGWPWAVQPVRNALELASQTHLQSPGNDPSARPKAQALQVPPERPMHVSLLWYFMLPSPLLAFHGGWEPTPPPGPIQAAGTSPREDVGVRDVPPCLAITASRKLVLTGSAPPELQ